MKKEVIAMSNQEQWVPRPHPPRMLYTETRTRSGVRVLTGILGRVTVWLRSDGTYVKQHANGDYSTGRWAQ